MLDKALELRPGEVLLFMAFDNDIPMLTITTGPTPQAGDGELTIQLFNRATGKPMSAIAESGVMHFILQLHTDMFAGLPGMLFLGLMGLLFFTAIVPGVALYTPFMRKLDFGTAWANRSTRVKWLDYHNMIGIVTLAWASVVGLTGRVVHTGKQAANVTNTLELPDWTRFDLGARYVALVGDMPLTLRFNVDNVANKRYWSSAFDSFRADLLQGAPRTFKLSASIEL